MYKHRIRRLTFAGAAFLLSVLSAFPASAAGPGEMTEADQEADRETGLEAGSAAFDSRTRAMKSSRSQETGPGAANTAPETEEAAADAALPEQENNIDSESAQKGELLGTFRVSGYCSCTKCTRGSGVTYSGTVPKASHTIAANLARFPLGTKLMIGETVYTVEDMGSGLDTDRIDIYFETHEEALAYGYQSAEVYAVRQENLQ